MIVNQSVNVNVALCSTVLVNATGQVYNSGFILKSPAGCHLTLPVLRGSSA